MIVIKALIKPSAGCKGIEGARCWYSLMKVAYVAEVKTSWAKTKKVARKEPTLTKRFVALSAMRILLFGFVRKGVSRNFLVSPRWLESHLNLY